jgi:hypothetical protein
LRASSAAHPEAEYKDKIEYNSSNSIILIHAFFFIVPPQIFYYCDKARRVKNNAIEIIAYAARKINLIIIFFMVPGVLSGTFTKSGERSADAAERCGRAPFCEDCAVRHSAANAMKGGKAYRKGTRIICFETRSGRGFTACVALAERLPGQGIMADPGKGINEAYRQRTFG